VRWIAGPKSAGGEGLRAAIVSFHGFDALEEVHHARGHEPVEDLGTAFVILDDPGVSQDGEVTGHGGHFGADHGGEFADATLAAGQFIDDQETAGMSEGLEDLGLGFEIGRFERVFAHGDLAVQLIR
jgi:hypothetical protein